MNPKKQTTKTDRRKAAERLFAKRNGISPERAHAILIHNAPLMAEYLEKLSESLRLES